MSSARDPLKLPTLLCLYVAQSVPMAFFTTVLPVIMRQGDYSLSQIGMLQLIKLPWILKLLWAPWVDRHARDGASLRRWIMTSELFYALVIWGLSWLELSLDFGLILLLIIVSLMASATQDIAVDKYAVLSLRRGERSWGNSMQAAGGFLGSLLGTGVLLMVYHDLGWQWVLTLLAGFIVLAMIPLWLRASADRALVVPTSERMRISLADIPSFFSSCAERSHLGLLLLGFSGLVGVMAMAKPLLVDWGYSTERIALMIGVLGAATAAGSALLGGWLIRLLGRGRTLAYALLVGCGATLYWAYLALGEPRVMAVYVAIALIWGAYGLVSVSLYTVAMDYVRPGREGTDFTLQIMLTQLSSLVIAALSGRLADWGGYTTLFVLEAGLSLLALGVLVRGRVGASSPA